MRYILVNLWWPLTYSSLAISSCCEESASFKKINHSDEENTIIHAAGPLSSQPDHPKPAVLQQAGPEATRSEETEFTDLPPDSHVKQVRQDTPEGRRPPDTLPYWGSVHQVKNWTHKNGGYMEMWGHNKQTNNKSFQAVKIIFEMATRQLTFTILLVYRYLQFS